MSSESGVMSSKAYLEGLPEVEATFHFTDPDSLTRALRDFSYNTMDQLGDKIVLVTEVPPDSVLVNDNEESPIPKSCRGLYFEDLRILVLVMPGTPHEVASRRFGDILGMKINDMNCYDDIVPTGSAEQSMSNVKKQPDASWSPREEDHITCVIESGVSESSRRLHLDARIWLEHKESHVAQVITIKIHRMRPEIVFSIWKATEGRMGTQRRAVLEQEVHVALENGRPTADGTLCLSFKELFERRPRRGTAECDIVFSGRELGGIARVVWERMGFMSR